MHDDLTSGFRAAFRGGAGNESWPIHKRHQPVVGSTGRASSKDQQRPLRFGQHVDRVINAFSIQPLAVETKRPHQA